MCTTLTCNKVKNIERLSKTFAYLSFLTRECAHAHERVIAIVDFSLGQSVGWLVGSVVNFRACAVNEFKFN